MTDKFGRPQYGDSKIGEERETDTGEFLKAGDLAALEPKESERREKEQMQGSQGGIKGADEPHIVHTAPHQGVDSRVPWSENKSVPIREPREEAGHYYGTFETQGFAQPGGWTQQAVSGVASLHETGYRQTLPPFGVEHSTDGPMPTAGSGGKLSGLQDSGSGKGGEAGLQRKQEEDATLKRTEEEMPSVDLGGSMPSGALGTTLQSDMHFSPATQEATHHAPSGALGSSFSGTTGLDTGLTGLGPQHTQQSPDKTFEEAEQLTGLSAPSSTDHPSRLRSTLAGFRVPPPTNTTDNRPATQTSATPSAGTAGNTALTSNPPATAAATEGRGGRRRSIHDWTARKVLGDGRDLRDMNTERDFMGMLQQQKQQQQEGDVYGGSKREIGRVGPEAGV